MEKIKSIIRKYPGETLILIACSVAANIFVYQFISQEKYLYFWDSVGFWNFFKEMGRFLRNNPLAALLKLIISVEKSDYNYLAVTILQPFNFLFGQSRLVYILALTNFFFIPALFGFTILITKLSNKFFTLRSPFPVFFFASLIFTFTPAVLIPLLLGYVDIVGLVVINIILILYFFPPPQKLNFKRSLIIGSLLALLVLFRRFYAYWSITFILVLFLENIFLYLKKRNFKQNPLIISLSFGVTMLTFGLGIVYKMIFINYANLYDAYRSKEGWQEFFLNFIQMTNYFSPTLIILFFMSFFTFIFKKQTQRMAFFLGFQFLLIFYLFSRTQDFSQHHFYLLLPTILIFVTLLAIKFYLFLNRTLSLPFLIICMTFLALSFMTVFYPGVKNWPNYLLVFFSSERHRPLVRNDLSQIYHMVQILEKLATLENDYVYVLSSSSVFNDDILKQACEIQSEKKGSTLCSKILVTRHVDKRDGPPKDFTLAKYVLVADPIQYHLKPSDQTVIGTPAKNLLEKDGIGKNYVKKDIVFNLENNVKVYLFENISPAP